MAGHPCSLYLAFAAFVLDGTQDSTFRGPFQLVTSRPAC